MSLLTAIRVGFEIFMKNRLIKITIFDEIFKTNPDSREIAHSNRQKLLFHNMATKKLNPETPGLSNYTSFLGYFYGLS